MFYINKTKKVVCPELIKQKELYCSCCIKWPSDFLITNPVVLACNHLLTIYL